MRAVIDQATCADIPALVDLMAEFHAESKYALDRKWAETSFGRLLTEPSKGAAWIARFNVGAPALYRRFGLKAGEDERRSLRVSLRKEQHGRAVEYFDR